MLLQLPDSFCGGPFRRLAHHRFEHSPGHFLRHSLGQIADAQPLLPKDLAMVWSEIIVNESHEGGFAFAISAEKASAFPLFNVKCHLIEDKRATKANNHVL